MMAVTSCIPTSKVTTDFTLGYHVEPQSRFLLIWDSQKKFPLANDLFSKVEPRFSANGFTLINFHNYETDILLRRKGIFVSENKLNIQELGLALGVHYILRAKVDHIGDGYIFDHYLRREDANYLDEGYISSSISLEVVSVHENSTYYVYKGEASNISFMISNLDNSDASTTKRAFDKIIKRFLKDAYPF
uniref:hypothetical protein n=1 Tax=Roseivirga sp. TaxID=1964215 RepID=UPI0040482FB2